MSSLSGTKELIAYFDRLEKSIQEDVLDVIEETTIEITRQAKANAPAAGDTVKTTYGTQKINTGINQYIDFTLENKGLSGKVFVEAGATELGAYLEFGTGSSAAGYVPTLPKEFQDMARTFYVNGKGTLIKHPFLLPAFFRAQKPFMDAMKKALAKKR